MNIAKMAIKLSADSSGLARDMGRAGVAVQQFASRAASVMGGLARTLGVGGLFSGLAGGGLFMMFRSGISDLEKFDRQARRLGMTVTDLRAAMHWGGGAEMGGIIGSVQGALADARMGGVGAGGMLADLRRASGAGASAGSFGDVVEQLSRIEDPAKRAAQAFRLMGDGASDVLQALNGPGGLGAARDAVERMGMGANAGDMNAVRQAAQAMREMDMIGKGFVQQVILGIAPLVAAIGEGFGKWGIDLRFVKDLAFQAGTVIGWIGVLLVEGTKNAGLFWDAFAVGLKLAEAGVIRLQILMGDLLHKSVFGDAKVIGIDDLIFGAGDGSGRIGGDRAPLEKAAAEAMREAERLKMALGTKLGNTDTGKAWQAVVDRANEIRKASGGVTEELVKQVPLLKQAAQQFGQMAQAAAGPGDAFRQQAAQLQQMGAMGFGGGGVLSMLYAKAGADLVSASGVAQYRAAGAALGNTREAYSAINQAQQTQRKDPVELLKAALDADARRQEMLYLQGQRIEQAIRDGKINLQARAI